MQSTEQQSQSVEGIARRLVTLGEQFCARLEQMGVPDSDLRVLRDEIEAMRRLADTTTPTSQRAAPVVPGQLSIYDLTTPAGTATSA